MAEPERRSGLPRWSAVALALRQAADDRLESRLSTYLHPLAGRTLVWHTMRAITGAGGRPLQLLLVSGDSGLAGGLDELHAETIVPARRVGWAARVSERLHPSVERVLIADAAAPALRRSLRELIQGPPRRALRGPDGEPLAVWLERAHFLALAARHPDLASLAEQCDDAAAGDDAFTVRDRAALARAGAQIRDRLVREHMAAGVTFILPETVVVDVEVRIGMDTLVYPGAVLEGRTTIGAESVIGPGCRIIDSQIGSGVELKGWNYVVNTSIRNRAVLEPYVRRGYD